MITLFKITKQHVRKGLLALRREEFKTAKVVYRRIVVQHLMCKGWEKAQAEVFLKGYQAHHIVPLSFGGANDFPNVAFVRPRNHKVIHDFIDAQKGDEIWIPYCGRYIWPSQSLPLVPRC